MKSKRSKACEFSKKAREVIEQRDKGCIFCKMDYHVEHKGFAHEIFSIMHYIPRSKGGLGIPQNGAIGCQYHHDLLDNGSKGLRPKMLNLFENYLKGFYPDWDKEKLYFNKNAL